MAASGLTSRAPLRNCLNPPTVATKGVSRHDCDLACFTAAAAVNLEDVLLEMNMPTLVEELSERARALSPEDRALLAEHLLESLPDESESEVEAAWDQEIARRVEQVRSGAARLIPAEEVHAEARRIYG